MCVYLSATACSLQSRDKGPTESGLLSLMNNKIVCVHLGQSSAAIFEALAFKAGSADLAASYPLPIYIVQPQILRPGKFSVSKLIDSVVSAVIVS